MAFSSLNFPFLAVDFKIEDESKAECESEYETGTETKNETMYQLRFTYAYGRARRERHTKINMATTSAQLSPSQSFGPEKYQAE
ncbi:hypothetical protein MMC27_002681 [Xylographa pallens]|nr:hypothetical protein [Xylographa pallens]